MEQPQLTSVAITPGSGTGGTGAISVGIYKVGAVVKNIHTCTFCMGERIEGLPDAQALDRVVAGTSVPFTVRGKERFWKAVQRLTLNPFQSAMISGE